MTASPHTDISMDNRLLKSLPANWIPFALLARIDRPVGIWLMLLPGWWGLTLTNAPIRYYVLFFFGALCMRAAGCAYNDIVDKDFDAKVERTKGRPLASGQLTIKQAWTFIGILLAVSFIILIQLSALAIALGIVAVALVAAYPWMKRLTYWPQAFLGIVFNWGVFMGYATGHNTITPACYYLYVAGFFWTLIYDTIYAHQDKEDDLLIGVKSAALALKGKTKSFLMISALIILLCLYSVIQNMYILTIIAGFFAWQIWSLNINNQQNCLRRFKLSQIVGWVILLGLFWSG